MSQISKKIAEDARSNTRDVITGGIIGRVINYHPPRGGGNGNEPDGSDKKAGRCFCDRHQGRRMKILERHTVDVEIVTERQTEVWNAVPCFMYAQGIIDHGFKKNDKVYIQFINNDLSHPVAIAYYRSPDKLDNFWNLFKYRMAGFVKEYVIDAIDLPGLAQSAKDSNNEGISESTDGSNVESTDTTTPATNATTKKTSTITTTPPSVTVAKERT